MLFIHRWYIAWKNWIKHWKGEIIFLVKLFNHPRLPKSAKILVFFLLSYIFSPIDLIPDFIPFIGHVDDFLLIPTTIWILKRIVPIDIIDEVRKMIEDDPNLALFSGIGPKIAAIIILLVWMGLSYWIFEVLNLQRYFYIK